MQRVPAFDVIHWTTTQWSFQNAIPVDDAAARSGRSASHLLPQLYRHYARDFLVPFSVELPYENSEPRRRALSCVYCLNFYIGHRAQVKIRQ
jgi:hypothetical protein